MDYKTGQSFNPHITRKGQLNFLPPVKVDRAGYPLKAVAVVLKNAGNTLVTINGSWTLRPGEAFNSAFLGYDFFDQTLDILFGTESITDTTLSAINRLEVATLTTNINNDACF